MGQFVIAAYKPKPGMDSELRRELREHVPALRREGLATERPPYLMQAPDGTYVEVFEWVSADAVERAHENPRVREMWARFERACTYVAPADLPGAREPFPGFEAVPD